MSTSAERMSVMEMKKECYVSMSFEDELEKLREAEPKKFSLPDSSQVDLTDQLIQVPELMFQPSLYGHETMGLHQLVQHCVEACSLDVRAQLLQNVLLCGGNSMFPNMAKRLQAEIRGLVDPEWEESLPMFKKAKCNFSRKANDKEDEQHKLSHQQFAAWTGGCILSSLEYFKNEYWISKASYDEKGPDYAYEQLRWFTV